MAVLMKGAPVAAAMAEKIRERAAALRSRGVYPTLALVRVGENDADIYYERAAMKRCDSCGIEVRNVFFPASVSQTDLVAAVRRLNDDASVHGVLIFRPLPRYISDDAVRAALAPEKDVDGITDASLGGVFTGSGVGFAPCTAESVMELLRFYKIPLAGSRVCVVGRSLVIGKPVSQLLMEAGATVTVCHRQTADLKAETRRADILVSAAGRRGVITIGHVTPGQVIVDVGINTDENGNMTGDVEARDVVPFVDAITPVPGGVGSVTTAILASHTVAAAERAVGR